jgi:hypothetical protein
MPATLHVTCHTTAVIMLLSSFRPAHILVLPYVLADVVSGEDPISEGVIIVLLKNMSEPWARVRCVWELASSNKM